jgi:NTP pyrophosphatase (non-canonical NTP hydrolase)
MTNNTNAVTISSLVNAIHQNAKDKGFWDTERNDGECIALMHSELSEALEGLRKGGKSTHIPDFSIVEEELADVIIRILDYCGARQLRIWGAIKAKMAYNETRPYKHGKKF